MRSMEKGTAVCNGVVDPGRAVKLIQISKMAEISIDESGLSVRQGNSEKPVII